MTLANTIASPKDSAADPLNDAPYCSVLAISKKLGLSTQTVRALIRSGRLKSVKVSPKRRAVGARALAEYLRSQNPAEASAVAAVNG